MAGRPLITPSSPLPAVTVQGPHEVTLYIESFNLETGRSEFVPAKEAQRRQEIADAEVKAREEKKPVDPVCEPVTSIGGFPIGKQAGFAQALADANRQGIFSTGKGQTPVNGGQNVGESGSPSNKGITVELFKIGRCFD